MAMIAITTSNSIRVNPRMFRPGTERVAGVELFPMMVLSIELWPLFGISSLLKI